MILPKVTEIPRTRAVELQQQWQRDVAEQQAKGERPAASASAGTVAQR